MSDISEYFIFQQDNVPAHRAKETVDLSTETPAFILPTLWPPNSPDLNPVGYKVWSANYALYCKKDAYFGLQGEGKQC